MRKSPGGAAGGECRVGFDRLAGETELAEIDIRRRFSGRKAVGRVQLVRAFFFRPLFQRVLQGKHCMLPADPVRPHAGFAVRHAGETRTNGIGDRIEHGVGIV